MANDVDHKPDQDKDKKAKLELGNRAWRDEANEAAGAGDGTTLMSWDRDVEAFMYRVDNLLRSMRVSMSHSEFKALVTDYRNLSMMERRAVANRLQRRRLSLLLRAIHGNDYRMYQEHWKEDAGVEASDGGAVDAPPVLSGRPR